MCFMILVIVTACKQKGWGNSWYVNYTRHQPLLFTFDRNNIWLPEWGFTIGRPYNFFLSGVVLGFSECHLGFGAIEHVSMYHLHLLKFGQHKRFSNAIAWSLEIEKIKQIDSLWVWPPLNYPRVLSGPHARHNDRFVTHHGISRHSRNESINMP